MSEGVQRRANPNLALRGLIWGGLLLLLVGGLGIVPAVNKAKSDANVKELTNIMVGYGSRDVAPNYALAWVLAVVALLGLLMLLAALVIRAAKPAN